MRAELGDADRPLVVAVGRLAPQKDYDTLLDAVGRLADGDSRSRWSLVAGDGPEHDRLQRVIDGRGLAVRLLGHRADVPDLLAAADVYVLTSTWEARALVVQEAMRAGVPVVATAVGGVPELVGALPSLVPPGDASAVARGGRPAAGRRRGARSWPATGSSGRRPGRTRTTSARQVAGVYQELAPD